MSATLSAVRITKPDQSSYVTSMAAGVTLADARAYFMGNVFTDEDPSGKETHWTAIKVESVTSEATSPDKLNGAAAFMQNPPLWFFAVVLSIAAACIGGVLMP